MAAQVPLARRNSAPLHLTQSEKLGPVHLAQPVEQDWHTLLFAYKPRLQLETQLAPCKTRGGVHELQEAALLQEEHWLWHVAHTVLLVAVQAVATN